MNTLAQNQIDFFHDQGYLIVENVLDTETLVAVRTEYDVLLHRRTAHSATDNRTERLRWSFDLRYQPPGQPTGRDCFPGFLARSRQHPEQVLSNPEGYRQNWLTARERVARGDVTARFNIRWNGYAGVGLCA